MTDKELRISRHALYRVRERISLGVRQILDILKSDKTIPIGHEQGKSRSHYLFYSREDRQCFIAVIDDADGTVITLLPEDYHSNIGWNVSQEAKDMAIKASGVEVVQKEEKTVPKVEVPIVEKAAPTFRVMGLVKDTEGKQKVVNLGSIPSEKYGGDVDNMFLDPEFIVSSRDKLAAKRPGSELLVLTVQLGKDGDIHSLPIYSVSCPFFGNVKV